MDWETAHRVQLLREGRRRLHRTTGWLAAGAVALAAMFGGLFGGTAVSHSAGTHHSTGSGSASTAKPGAGDSSDGSGGSGLVPPNQAPRSPQNQGGGTHAQSGAS